MPIFRLTTLLCEMKRSHNGTPSKILNWTAARNSEKTPTKNLSEELNLTISNASPVKLKTRSQCITKNKINTFIFMDLETTGLFRQVGLEQYLDIDKLKTPDSYYNCLNKYCLETTPAEYPRITEISLMSLPRNTFIDMEKSMQNDLLSNKTSLKRFIPCNVHTRQINPNLSDSEWDEYEERQLKKPSYIVHSKKHITLMSTFQEEWPKIIDFINLCEKPVAFVAHNGIKFDFRVLYGEMQRYGLLKSHPIPDDVFFIDSFITFSRLDGKMFSDTRNLIKQVDFAKIFSIINNASKNNTNGEADVSTNLHPLDFIKKSNWSVAKTKKICRDHFKCWNGLWDIDLSEANKYKKSLKALYEHIINDTFDSHYAQPDTEALLLVAIGYGNDFIDFVDDNCAEFPF